MFDHFIHEADLRQSSGCRVNQPDLQGYHSQANTPQGVLFFVEGPNDIEFLRRISRILHQDDQTIPDLNALEEAGRLIFVPFGGGCLHYWSHRLGPLIWPEFHLYDREAPPETMRRLKAVRAVSSRPGCYAVVTSKRSLENYLNTMAIEEALGIRVRLSDTESVPDLIAQAYLSPQCSWKELSARAQRRLRNRIKKGLNTIAVDQMTAARLHERDPQGELAAHFRMIGSMALRR